jgi:hypothetical protein
MTPFGISTNSLSFTIGESDHRSVEIDRNVKQPHAGLNKLARIEFDAPRAAN